MDEANVGGEDRSVGSIVNGGYATVEDHAKVGGSTPSGSEAREAFGLNGVPCVEESRERGGSHKRVDHQRCVVALLVVHSTSGSTTHIEAIHNIQEPQRRSPRTSYRQPLKYSPS